MPAVDQARARGLAHRIPDAADALLDVVVVTFALWTVTFHLALAFDWRRDLAALVWLVLLAVAGAVWFVVRAGRRRPPGAPRTTDDASGVGEAGGGEAGAGGRRDATAPVLAIVSAATVGLLTALYAAWARPSGAAWWVVWGGVVVATTAGVLLTLRHRRLLPADRRSEPAEAAWPTVLVVVVALGMALLSMMTLRPEGDDVYVMNQALYVEAHDEPFPERDTIFADQVFRDTRPHDLPASAIEPLIGVTGRWLPFSTPTVAYLLLAPAVSFLAVFAVWRLARTLRVSWPALATTGAMVFLFLDGAENPSFGNMSFTRSWQGKSIVVFLLLPLVWHYALSWARDGNRRGLLGLLAALVAAVGLSSTGLGVIPAAAAAVLVAGVAMSRRPARLPAAATAFAYPVLAWIIARQAERQAPIVDPAATGGTAASVASAAGGSAGPATSAVPPPDVPAPAPFEFSGDLQGLDPDTLWYFVFGNEFTSLLVAVTAVALTWLVLRDRASRLAMALASLGVFAVFYAPGAAERIHDATGTGAVLWRSVWIVPLPLMIGLLLAAPMGRRSALMQLGGTAASVGVLTALLITGTPVIDGPRVSNFGRPAWDVEPVARTAASRLTDLAEPGSIAAVPERIGWALSSITIKVRPVNPRGFEMVGGHAVAEFRALDRRLLSEATERGLEPGEAERFGVALDALRISIACVNAGVDDPSLDGVFEQHGFAVVEQDDICAYWRRGSIPP